MTTMRKSDYAERCGVTPGTISKWIKRGIITNECLGLGHHIIVEKADAAVRAHLDPMRSLGARSRVSATGSGPGPKNDMRHEPSVRKSASVENSAPSLAESAIVRLVREALDAEQRLFIAVLAYVPGVPTASIYAALMHASVRSWMVFQQRLNALGFDHEEIRALGYPADVTAAGWGRLAKIRGDADGLEHFAGAARTLGEGLDAWVDTVLGVIKETPE